LNVFPVNESLPITGYFHARQLGIIFPMDST